MKIVKMDEVLKAPAESPLFTGSDVTRQDLLPEIGLEAVHHREHDDQRGDAHRHAEDRDDGDNDE